MKNRKKKNSLPALWTRRLTDGLTRWIAFGCSRTSLTTRLYFGWETTMNVAMWLFPGWKT